MFYYQFHVGDFLKKTAHLDLQEDAIYRRLLDLCYTTERPLTKDINSLARAIRARGMESTVESILKEFFTEEDDGWHNGRADKEIKTYQGFSDAGKKGAEKRWGKDNPPNSPPIHPPIDPPNRVDMAPTIATDNHKPITNNQEPNIIGNLPATVENKQLAKARSPKGSRLSKEWVLPKDWGNWALEKGLPRDKVILEAEKFRNYWTSKSGSGATKVDWMATWHNWILKACEDFGSENKTFAERTQDFKNKQAEEFYAAGIGSASEDTLRKLRLIP